MSANFIRARDTANWIALGGGEHMPRGMLHVRTVSERSERTLLGPPIACR
jgi:hypothetical protein